MQALFDQMSVWVPFTSGGFPLENWFMEICRSTKWHLVEPIVKKINKKFQLFFWLPRIKLAKIKMINSVFSFQHILYFWASIKPCQVVECLVQFTLYYSATNITWCLICLQDSFSIMPFLQFVVKLLQLQWFLNGIKTVICLNVVPHPFSLRTADTKLQSLCCL